MYFISAFLLSNGSKIEEKFDEPLKRSWAGSHFTAGKFDIARNNIYPFGESAFGHAVVSVRFPSSEQHPSFGCKFDGRANSSSSFICGMNYFSLKLTRCGLK